MRWMIALGASVAMCSQFALADEAVLTAEAVSEKDFLGDMPVVLSVSRLPQRLDDTPGAVTVIDRDMIRRTGARDVAELLRWVPGFQVSSSFEADAPQASYHGAFGEYSSRIQLLIDGRSAYSTYLVGSIGPGLQSVALEDIERIEVLRGSNSAAYGARAFLGVINIVTRDPADTRGALVSAAQGENGVKDRLARLSGGTDSASFRLTLDERSDAGLTGSNGRNTVRNASFRAGMRLSARDEIQVHLGQGTIDAGVGFAGDINKPLRDRAIGSSYAQLDWRRNLGEDSDIAFSAVHTEESVKDMFLYSLAPLGVNDSIAIDFGGTGRNDTLSMQHTFRAGPGLRVVWGGELRREEVSSLPLYGIDTPLITNYSRLFGNVEWRMTPAWVLNAGGMLEKSSVSGDSFAPRLMLNWHAAPGHTLRVGVSRASRPPTTFESFANVRYVYKGIPLQMSTVASGGVQPEGIVSREIGYLGTFAQVGVHVDVRLFQEQVQGFVRRVRNPAFVFPAGTVLKTAPFDYVNADNFQIRGLEYQMQWRPAAGTRVVLSQAYTENSQNDTSSSLAAPLLASSIMWFQKLPWDLDLSLMHQDSGSVTPPASSGDAAATTRTDLRLAKTLRIGSSRAELALVVQNLGQPYADFNTAFRFERRAFLTLRVEN